MCNCWYSKVFCEKIIYFLFTYWFSVYLEFFEVSVLCNSGQAVRFPDGRLCGFWVTWQDVLFCLINFETVKERHWWKKDCLHARFYALYWFPCVSRRKTATGLFSILEKKHFQILLFFSFLFLASLLTEGHDSPPHQKYKVVGFFPRHGISTVFFSFIYLYLYFTLK